MSTRTRPRLLHRLVHEDDGLGLILVLGISIVVFGLIATALAYALNGVKQAKQRTQYEQSLATSENGIDSTLARLQDAFSAWNDDYPVPAPANARYPEQACNDALVAWPAVLANGTVVSDIAGNFLAAGGLTSQANEKLWARQKLDALRTAPSCVHTGGEGQYVVLKPLTTKVNGLYPKYGKVYALGAVPAFGAARSKTRLLKAEYVFMPYRPIQAVLTGSDLEIGSSVKITGAAGTDPTLAGVHTNGQIIVNGGSAAVITGTVSSTQPTSATISGVAVKQAPTQKLPTVSARSFYYQAPSNDPAAMSSWRDLCYDPATNTASVKPWSSGGPCTADPSLATTPASIGWTFSSSGHTWTATRDSVSGTYYVYNGNVVNGSGQAVLPNMTVIAASENPTNCTTKRYGNISWDHYDLSAPAFHNLWFYGDGDVRVDANIKIGQGATTPPVVSGMIVAGDQVYLQTSSNSAVGSVVATDNCVGSPQPTDSMVDRNTVKNLELYYDPNSDAPFTSIITNSLWLDYSG